MEPKSIKIKPFNVANMKKYSTVLIIGRIATGKSSIIRHIMKNKSDQTLNQALIFENVEELGGKLEMESDKFHNLSPFSYVIDEKSQSDHDKMIDLVGKLKMVQSNRKDNKGHWLIIDEVLDSKEFRKKEIKDVISYGRHMHIFSIFSFRYQKENIDKMYPPIIPPDIRANFDYIFLSMKLIEKLSEIIIDIMVRCLQLIKSLNLYLSG